MRNIFEIFNSNVFVEIGEAVGNVRGKLKKSSAPELVDKLFRERLAQSTVELPDTPGAFVEPEVEVIDAEYHVLSDEEVQL